MKLSYTDMQIALIALDVCGTSKSEIAGLGKRHLTPNQRIAIGIMVRLMPHHSHTSIATYLGTKRARVAGACAYADGCFLTSLSARGNMREVERRVAELGLYNPQAAA